MSAPLPAIVPAARKATAAVSPGGKWARQRRFREPWRAAAPAPLCSPPGRGRRRPGGDAAARPGPAESGRWKARAAPRVPFAWCWKGRGGKRAWCRAALWAPPAGGGAGAAARGSRFLEVVLKRDFIFPRWFFFTDWEIPGVYVDVLVPACSCEGFRVWGCVP